MASVKRSFIAAEESAPERNISGVMLTVRDDLRIESSLLAMSTVAMLERSGGVRNLASACASWSTAPRTPITFPVESVAGRFSMFGALMKRIAWETDFTPSATKEAAFSSEVISCWQMPEGMSSIRQ